MKKALLSMLFVAAIAAPLAAQPPSEPTGQKTLAATVGVYVFPAEGQDTATQNREEAECYAWAVKNTGNDPFDLDKQAQRQAQQADQAKQQVEQSGQGAGVKGAAGGAMVGALIGEINDDDPGEGALYGAAVGALAARRRARRQKDAAKEEIDQQTQQAQRATAEQIEGFKKAFSLCLEAKKYLVKI